MRACKGVSEVFFSSNKVYRAIAGGANALVLEKVVRFRTQFTTSLTNSTLSYYRTKTTLRRANLNDDFLTLRFRKIPNFRVKDVSVERPIRPSDAPSVDCIASFHLVWLPDLCSAAADRGDRHPRQPRAPKRGKTPMRWLTACRRCGLGRHGFSVDPGWFAHTLALKPMSDSD